MNLNEIKTSKSKIENIYKNILNDNLLNDSSKQNFPKRKKYSDRNDEDIINIQKQDEKKILKAFNKSDEGLKYWLIKNFENNFSEDDIEENFEKVLDYYKENKIDIDGIVKFLKNIPKEKTLDLYRLICVTRLSNLNIERLGDCWSDKEHATDFAYTDAGLSNIDEKNIIVVHVKTDSSNINLSETVEVNLDSYEFEYRLWKSDINNYDIISITPLLEFKKGNEFFIEDEKTSPKLISKIFNIFNK